MKEAGNLEGILLTGLTKDGVDLMESYVDRTGDVQTASYCMLQVSAIWHCSWKQNAKPYSPCCVSQVKHTSFFLRFGVLVLLRTCVVSNDLNLISLSRSFFQSEKSRSWLHLSSYNAQMEAEPQVRVQPVFHKGLPLLFRTVVSFHLTSRREVML